MDKAMFYAVSRAGLPGESTRIMPASYLASHVVDNGGVLPMPAAWKGIVAELLARGWIERCERTIAVAEDTERHSMFYGTPAHTLISVTYRATEKGRTGWSTGGRA